MVNHRELATKQMYDNRPHDESMKREIILK